MNALYSQKTCFSVELSVCDSLSINIAVVYALTAKTKVEIYFLLRSFLLPPGWSPGNSKYRVARATTLSGPVHTWLSIQSSQWLVS